jgi:hypothetical protein
LKKLKKKKVKKESVSSEQKFEPASSENKIKVGFEYRYRISKLIADVGPKAALSYKKPVAEKVVVVERPLVKDEEQNDDHDGSPKPKVGFEHRYRVSNLIKNAGAEPKEDHQNEPSDSEPIYNPEEKPKVGFEHRYRVNTKLSNQHGEDTIITAPKIIELEDQFDPKLKPKVGFEHRYRISKMLLANQTRPNTKKSLKREKKAKSRGKKNGKKESTR